ncbi:hypothetical protein ACQCSX_14360 [Pseudarthrobacter sp. P1]|uniref:hypothetical protein n=1 Tax=Pseudarthrobacter sp. P1 TaxID=3418418 RepID=UPI003CF5D52C
MIYAVEPSAAEGVELEEDSSFPVAPEVSSLRNQLNEAARDPEAAFIALKIALPTSHSDYTSTSTNGRVKYVLNKVAQKYWMSDYEELS